MFSNTTESNVTRRTTIIEVWQKRSKVITEKLLYNYIHNIYFFFLFQSLKQAKNHVLNHLIVHEHHKDQHLISNDFVRRFLQQSSKVSTYDDFILINISFIFHEITDV